MREGEGDRIDNVAGIIGAVVAGDPDRPALIVDGAVCSYGELAAEACRWAGTLSQAGVGPGDRIAVADWGGVRSTAVALGAAWLGAAAALLNPMLTTSELAAVIEGCDGIGVGIAADEAAPALAAALGPDGLVLREPADEMPPERAPGGEAEALVLFTSGTTGVPKPVSISHSALLARVQAYRQPFAADRPAAVTCMCVPSFHIGGMLGLLVTLYGADTTVVLPRFDAGAWLAAVERHRVGTAFLVPTMLARILDHPAAATTDLSAMRLISYGAAASPPALIARAMARWPHVGFANTFGQTETLGAYASLSPEDHHDPRRIGSVGRPLPGVEVKIVDPETGAELPAGAQGELWVRTGQVVAGARDDGWLATGDLAHRDADGYLHPAGRRSDTINRGGEKFEPVEVAEAIRAHPAVADVAVAGVPDDEMGHRVGALVVVAGGAAAPSLDELRAWARSTLAPFKLPEIVVVVDALPTNDVGKVPTRAVAELLRTRSEAP